MFSDLPRSGVWSNAGRSVCSHRSARPALVKREFGDMLEALAAPAIMMLAVFAQAA